MATLRVLYIAGRTLSLFTVSGRNLLDTQIYGHDHAGLAAFTDDIMNSPKHPTWILPDLAEEEFHNEKLPHVFGRDQKNMLNRKINNFFHDSRFRQASKQGREASGRRDDRFLITGISDPEMLDPWIDILLNNHIAIPGIHSVPMLMPRLLAILKPAYTHVIIISHGSMSGMRQTYFNHGELKASRLTPTHQLDSQGFLELAATETNKFWRFLTSSHTLPNDETVHVLLLGNSSTQDALAQFNLDNPLIKFHVTGLDELQEKMKFKGISDSSKADEFLAMLLSTSHASNPYATHKERRFYYHRLAGRGLTAAAGITILYALFTLPGYVIDGLDHYKQLNQTNAQQAQYLQLYKEARRTMPASPETGTTMHQAVQVHHEIEQKHTSPFDLMKNAGSVLIRYPAIQPGKIKWQANSMPIMENNRTVEAFTGTSDITPANAQHPSITISGSINPGHGGLRQSIEMLDKLVQELNVVPEIHQAEVLSYPIEIDPQKALLSKNNPGAIGAENSGMFSIHLQGRRIR